MKFAITNVISLHSLKNFFFFFFKGKRTSVFQTNFTDRRSKYNDGEHVHFIEYTLVIKLGHNEKINGISGILSGINLVFDRFFSPFLPLFLSIVNQVHCSRINVSNLRLNYELLSRLRSFFSQRHLSYRHVARYNYSTRYPFVIGAW